MEKSRINIACVGYFQGFGGAEKSLISLSNELKERGYNVSIINIGNGEISYQLNEEIKIININVRNKIKRFLKFRKVVVKNKYDIIINYWTQSAIFSAMFCKKYKIKTIYSERADPSDKEYTGFLGFLSNKYFKNIDGFVFQTEAAKDYFSENIRNKSVIIHNPIFIKKDDYKIPKVRKQKIVNVGRLHNQKNQKFLLEVFKKFLEKHPNYILELYGDGPLKEKLKEYSKELNIDKYVKFMGNRKDIYSCIIDAKMFILTSRYEGMPNVVLEAMALGIPTICSNYRPKDAVYEIIENGKNGFVFEQDDKKELLRIMEKIVNNDELVKQISYNSKNICATHSKENIYNKWESFINKILNI